MKKYADPEWARLNAEKQAKEWKEESDPLFQMRKEQYEMSKAYAEMMYKSNPKYSQAKFNYETADCEADFSKFQDPKWQKASADYRYYTDFDLDYDWSPKWRQIKKTYEQVEKELQQAKEQTSPCSQYVADMKAAKEEAMSTYFSTEELKMIRKQNEEAEQKEEELEQ